MIGRTISKYRILSLIGTGNMGHVYLARDTTLNRPVALKFLPAAFRTSSQSLSRFYREARTAAALNHPNIVTVHEIGEFEHAPYIVMEHVEGHTLVRHLEFGPLDIKSVLSWSIALADGLAKAHASGIVHRDLKPSNIIIDSDGRPRILDFGVAKLMEGEDLTARGTTIGTLAYMAPEQLDGLHIDRRVDIWALGGILYQMTTGQRPFRGIRTAALAYSILHATPPSVSSLRSDVPAGLDHIVAKCLAKEVNNRYHDSTELQHDLSAVASGSSAAIQTQPYGAPAIPLRSRLHSSHVMAVAILTVVLVALLTGFGKHRVTSTSISTTTPVTLAILPIRNLSPPDYEYFADGLTDDLIARASQISGMRVLSRLSTMTLKGERYEPGELIERLHADVVLEGSVMQVDGRFHATVSLIDLHSQEIRWAGTFDSDLTDIFATQAVIVQRVATSLNIELAPNESQSIAELPTHNLTAYKLCQRARQYYYRYTADANEYAVALYQRALLQDSLYVDAISGLADSYVQRTLRFGQSNKWVDTALIHAQYALSIDSTHADANKALGLAYLAKGWYRDALEANLRSLKFNPNHFAAASNAGMLSLLMGDLPQALRMHLKAATLAPTQGLIAAYVANDYAQLTNDNCAQEWFERALSIQPDLGATLGLRAYWNLSRGHTEDAMDDCQRALQMDTTVLLLRQTGDAALFHGDLSIAKGYYELAIQRSGDSAAHVWLPLAHVLMQTGHSDSARTIVSRCLSWDRELIQRGDQSPESRHRLCVANSMVGDSDQAIDWYRKAVERGWSNWRYDDRHPMLSVLRDHPAYVDIRDRIREAVESAKLDHDHDDCTGAVQL